MQNLTIATTQPDTPAQASIPTGNGAEQAAEPFGSVLARQCTGASAPDSDQFASSSAAWTSIVVTGDETTGEAQAPIADAAAMLPGNMPAALLPVLAATNRTAANEKPDPRVRSADEVGTLPGGMPAVLLPATAQAAGAAVALGEPRQSASNQAASLFRAQGNAMPVGADAGAGIAQGNAFPSVLETSGKDVASTILPSGTARISAQAAQPDAAALPGLAQIGATPLAASLNGPAQAVVGTPLAQGTRAHDAWSDEFSQKITWLATQHQQTAELHLNPPHLGPLDVVLSVSGDQTTALFTSPHAAVRDAVEQALPKLREMLADSGIMLGNATVSDQAPRERQKGETWPGKKGDVISLGGIQAGATAWPGRRQQGMVDTFA